ncbi:hypothetical protein [Pseudanabaena sp. PCC 6802]|uniref:hypothetical protein n=1 Tax=Pseudanabaena sp. PCC 6802 TaxID=118173 RepID=UPI00034B89C4|nr:hypothetical protein [Pseudanabaena sp. PCC 6802]
MAIREATIAKLQHLPESILQEVSDFIDFVMLKHKCEKNNDESQENISQAWTQWFESVERLEVSPTKLTSEYQQLLLNKFRQQGLEL